MKGYETCNPYDCKATMFELRLDMGKKSENHRRIALPSQPWKAAWAIDKSEDQLAHIAVVDPPVFLWKNRNADTITRNFARAIHEKSRFAKQPFMTISCQSNPQSSWKQAMAQLKFRSSFDTMSISLKSELETCIPGGTLYLDEVAALPWELQRGLLALIDHDGLIRFVRADRQEVEVRIISASTMELWNTIAKGTLRADLFFRLNVLAMRVPSQTVNVQA